jgi:hypothetical protein
MTTSSRQCSRFSTPQWARTTSLKRSGVSGALSRLIGGLERCFAGGFAETLDLGDSG